MNSNLISSKPNNVLILTAGLGTRLRPLTEKIAKPAVPFLNLPMLGYSLFCAEQIQPTNVFFNTFHCADTVRVAATKLTENAKYKAHFSHEEPVILGRGGAIKKLEKELSSSENFLLLNGDSINLFQDMRVVRTFWEQHLQSGALATVFLTPFEGGRQNRSAVWLDSEGHVKGFGPNPPGPSLTGLHYPGILAMSSKLISDMPAGEFDIFYDTFVGLIAKGEVLESYVVDRVKSFETGNAKDYLNSTKACLRFLADQKSSYGRQISATLKRFNIKHDLLPGPTLLGENSRLELNHSGFVVVASNVQVNGSGTIMDSIVLDSYEDQIDTDIKDQILF